MSVWSLTKRASICALVLTGFALTGCGNTSGGGEKRWPSSGWVAPEWEEGPKKAPAPAPQPAKPAPAPKAEAKPAPAPAMTGDSICLPTGDRATSTVCLRCGMPREVVAGTNFTYDIEVCNVTSLPLQNVMVSYSLDGAKIVSTEPAASGNNFPVGDLAPRQCKTIKITANAAGTGSVRGCLGATWNNSLCCTTNVVQPALKVVKSVTPAEGTPCDVFTYKVDVTNTGTGAAGNVKLTDNLPANLTSDNKSNLSWDLGTIGAGQTVSRTFTAKAGKTGSYSNNASVSADNNLSAKSNDVAIAVKQPVLAIAKVCPGNLRLGRSAAFKVTVSNKGDAPATGTVVEDNLPAGSTFVSATDGGTLQGNKVVWNLGTLAAGANKELGLVLNVGAGKISNSASARCNCAEAVTANCGFDVQGVPDIGTQITDDNGVVQIPQPHVFRYEVKNQGQVDLTNVTMVATLDAGLEFVSSDAAQAATVAGNKVTFKIGTLKIGQIIKINVTCKGTKDGQLVIRSETTSDQTQPVRNDEQVNYITP